MKKIIALLTIAGVMTFGISNFMFAQDTEADTTAADTTTVSVQPAAVETVEMVTEPEPETFHEVLKDQFIQGGPEFMGIVLLTLIFWFSNQY